MWTTGRLAVLLTLTLGIACLACSSKPPAPLDASTDERTALTTPELLAATSAALASGDVVEATRLAELARAAELTDEEAETLDALEARFGEPDPTADTVGPHVADGGGRTPYGQVTARVLRPVPTEHLDAAGYDALPFFQEYSESSACCRSAWFDIGELAVSGADEPAPPHNRRGPSRDRVVVFDFSELLHAAGVDPAQQPYYGVTRARDGRLHHHYEDAHGRAVTGVTERHDGAVRTLLVRHAD